MLQMIVLRFPLRLAESLLERPLRTPISLVTLSWSYALQPETQQMCYILDLPRADRLTERRVDSRVEQSLLYCNLLS